MNLKRRQAVGKKIAELVIQAESKFPAPGSGPIKRTWVLKEAAKESPTGKGPSHDFARWLGRSLLRVALEAAVAVIHILENLEDDDDREAQAAP